MFQIAKPIFFVCETPLHAGAGGGIGTELPIQREEHTLFPKIEASGIKGALRESFEKKYKDNKTDPELVAIFGHPDKGDENAGALGFTDGRLLLFPVRSRQAIFAWVTCPRVLTRFARDLHISKENGGGEEVGNLAALLKKVNGSTVATSSQIIRNGSIFLEDYSIEVEENNDTQALAANLAQLMGIPELPGQFAVVSDEYFSHFVQHCTEIQTRIKIGENGVVTDGALFTEEHLPAESILYALIMANPEFTSEEKLTEYKRKRWTAQNILDIFKKSLPSIVQMGGNATLGKGIIQITPKFL